MGTMSIAMMMMMMMSWHSFDDDFDGHLMSMMMMTSVVQDCRGFYRELQASLDPLVPDCNRSLPIRGAFDFLSNVWDGSSCDGCSDAEVGDRIALLWRLVLITA
jgi:hypothetical protein